MGADGRRDPLHHECDEPHRDLHHGLPALVTRKADLVGLFRRRPHQVVRRLPHRLSRAASAVGITSRSGHTA